MVIVNIYIENWKLMLLRSNIHAKLRNVSSENGLCVCLFSKYLVLKQHLAMRDGYAMVQRNVCWFTR